MRTFLKLSVTLLCHIPLIGMCQATYQGLSINFNALPVEAKLPIASGITPGDFALRLKAGGTVILDGMDTTIGAASPTSKGFAFLALDRLELRHGARIITNGNTLVIFVNTLVSDNGKILSFDTGMQKAMAGAPAVGLGGSGNPGTTGLAGGLVSIHIIQSLEGQLHVALSGQTGGDGSAGNQGQKGSPGSRGADGQDGPLGVAGIGWCKQGGQDGGPGGQGFAGGAGGSGGAGGDGGILELYNVGASPIPSSAYDFIANPGGGGSNGTGGPGGPGGDGGSGGSGTTYCGGGHGGSTGQTGNSGYTIPTPPSSGARGQLIVKAITLEQTVKNASGIVQPK